MEKYPITIGTLNLENLTGSLKYAGGELVTPSLKLKLQLDVKAHAPIIGTKSKSVNLDIPMKVGDISIPGGPLEIAIPSGSLSVASNEAEIPLTPQSITLASMTLDKTSIGQMTVGNVFEAMGINIPQISIENLQLNDVLIPDMTINSAINPSWSGSADTGKIGWGDLYVEIKVTASVALSLGGIKVNNTKGSMSGQGIQLAKSDISVRTSQEKIMSRKRSSRPISRRPR